MADLGELSARISAEIEQFEKGLDEASKKAGEFGTTSERAGKDASKGFGLSERGMKNLNRAMKIGATSIAAAGAALAVATARALESADQHIKLARAMGITNEELAVLERAAELSGVSVGELNNSTRRLNRAITDAGEGTGRAADAFETLGVSVEELEGLNAQEQLEVLSGAFEGIESRAERASIAQDLFGRSGTNMLNLLNNTEATFDRATDEVEAFGLALSDTEANSIEAANDNISALRNAMGGMARQLAATVAPAIRDITDSLIDMAEEATRAQRAAQETIRARRRVGTDEEELTDRLTTLYARRERVVQQFGNLLIREQNEQRAHHEESLAQIDAEIRAERDRVVQEQRAQAMNESGRQHVSEAEEAAAQEAAERAEAEAAAAAEAQVHQERLQEAYAKTKEGMIAATEESIRYFETFTPRGPMATAILNDLNEQLEELRNRDDGEDTGPDFAGMLGDIDEDLQSRRDTLREGMMTEAGILYEEMDRQQQIISEALAAREITEQEALDKRAEIRDVYQQQVEAAEEEHQNRLPDEAEREAQERQQLMMQVGTGMASNLTSIYRDLASTTTDEEKKLFDIRKNAAIATAVINGIESTVSSYKFGAQLGGPVLGAAFAATAAAATGAQIAALRSQSYNGGGSTPAPPSEDPETSEDVQRTMVIQSDFDANQLFSGAAVRNLLDSIEEANQDGYNVVVS